MAKKRKYDDDDIENVEDFETENDSYSEESTSEEVDAQDSSDSNESLFDDDVEMEIVIEISDDESLDILEEDTKIKELEEEIVLSKHKLQGKHSLKYDSIFKGKKEDKIDQDSEEDYTLMYFNEKFEVDKSSYMYLESQDNEMYIRSKNIKEKVYQVLLDKTSINFLNNRRKPSRSDFNHYYHLLKVNLEEDGFTNIELFNELSIYFSDNLFNMFKLLDNKWRNLIIIELQDHIGKYNNSKEITNRNIHVGTEIEFEHHDALDNIKIFTGVVTMTDYQISSFEVNSYENLYDIHISKITKILNNTKFKYNLNKLNNIDFL
jgi:hypothetical protein